MEETRTIPEEKNFNLAKVKLLPNGGIEADYQITEVIGDEPSISDYKTVCTRDVHPDLKGLFASLRWIVSSTFGLTSYLHLLEDKEKIDDAVNNINAKIEVRGVAWSGTGDKAGVVLTSVFECANGLKTAINTPRIKLGQATFGFEVELEQMTERIREEVYLFLFKGKQAQLSLFGESAPANDMPEE